MGKDGALNGQVTEYVNGVNKVVKGVEDYTSGTISLSDGVKSYVAGEEQIAAGAGQLTTLKEGLTEIKTAITTLHEAVDGKGNSSEDIYAASQALAEGTKKLNDSISSMKTLMDQVDAMTSAGKKLTAQAGEISKNAQSQILVPTEKMMETGAQMMESLQTLTKQLEGMKTTCQKAVDEASASLTSQVNEQITAKNSQIAAAKKEAETTNSQIDSAITQLKSQIAKAEEKGDSETAKALLATVKELSGAKVDTGNLSALDKVKAPQVTVNIQTRDFSKLQAMVSDMQSQFTTI